MTSETSFVQPQVDQNEAYSYKVCQQKSIFKSAFQTFVKSFSKGLALSVAILLTLCGFIAFFNSPLSTKYTSIEVIPNHMWIARSFSSETDTIIQISVNGPIGFGPNSINKDQVFDIIADIHEINFKPDAIKAIFLNINSPGGTSDDSDAIYRLITEVKQKYSVPVYAYVDGECCSGGMLIALSADKIIASSQSVVGHVGVIMGTAFNFSNTMTRLGIDAMTLHAGKGKDELNPFRPWKPTEGQSYQQLIEAFYTRFTKLVAQHRPKLTIESLKEQGARAYPADQALELGYIDEINDSRNDVLEKIAQETNCGSQYQLIELKPTLSLADIFFSESSVFRKNKVEHMIRVPGDVHPDVVGKPLYYRAQ